MSNKKINILNLFIYAAKNKWVLTITIISITLLSLIISLLWPKTYRASTKFIQSTRNAPQVGGLLQNYVNMPMSSSKVGSEEILEILKSNKIKDLVIEEFDLSNVYDTDIREALREKVTNKTKIIEVREGGFGFNPIVSIEIAYLDEKPERAYNIVKFYVNKLDSLVTRLNYENTNRNFQLIKSRFERNKKELDVAENKLKNFREEHGILEVNSQVRQIISNLAEIKSEIISTEVQLNILNNKITDSNKKYDNLVIKREELQDKYNELIQGENNTRKELDVYKSVNELPDLMNDYMELFREVTVQEETYKQLYPLYEQQKMLVKENSSGINIIDPARIPTYKFKPKRAYIVIAGFLFSIILSIFIITLKEIYIYEKTNNTNNYKKLNDIYHYLKN